MQAAVAAYRAELASAGGGEGGGPTAATAGLAALLSFEIGGGNGIEPLVAGARMGLPVVDADLMGRAFPEMQARPQC